MFFRILLKFKNRIAKLEKKDIENGWKLFLAFDCKFLARDFDQLYNEIQIFNLLFRGGELVTLSHNFFERSTYNKSYKILHETFVDVFLAIVARISESDAIQTM